MLKRAGSISIDSKFDSIPILPHGESGIFISKSAIIGKKCVIFQQVTIGANTIKDSKSYGAPILGDNVYIGAGAKIIGGVKVGDNVRIGANAVVTKDVPANTLVISQEVKYIQKDNIDNAFNPYL